jgi:hypothetical protein
MNATREQVVLFHSHENTTEERVGSVARTGSCCMHSWLENIELVHVLYAFMARKH